MTDQVNAGNEQEFDYHDQVAMRKSKLDHLRKEGNAYPNDIKPSDFAGDILKTLANKNKEELAGMEVSASLCGRVMNRRVMGKASFVHMQDFTGKIQVYIRGNDLDEGVYDAFKSWDLGDIIYVSGTLFRTKTNEITVHAKQIKLITKALRPMPDKYHGLCEKEICYRQRYLDLIANQETRDVFTVRANAVAAIRNYLTQARFLEVETPMMHSIAGGAAARPFTTHHNALDIPLFMRIAPELFLKRLIVGGMDRVFEINRNFRNEGLSTRHNPEFTMLEFYQAYADYNDFMDFTESMMQHVVKTVVAKDILPFNGMEIDFSAPFTRISMQDSILHYNSDINESDICSLEAAKSLAKKLGIDVISSMGLGSVQLEIFEKTVEKKLVNPTFITHYPTDVSPLSRRNDENSEIVDRCELFIGGQEVANIFSELNDPEDQAKRFKDQVAARAAGDVEAMEYDAEYVEALEYGMPPAAGAGIGIDRFVMMLTDSAAIRDVILFPLLRPISQD